MTKKNYELMLVLPDGKQQKEAEALVKEWLSKSGGKVVSVDFWGKKDLVYPIKKQMKGVYVLFELELAADEATELQKRIKLEEGLLRHLLVVKNQRIIKDNKPAKLKSKKE
jgi:small subunit ribosomal protein S6